MGLLDGFFSLGRDLNKTKGEFTDERKEGIASETLDELTLSKADDELSSLAKKWKQRWENSEIKKELDRKQAENEKYWLGDHYTPAQKKTGIRDPIDNLIFEALETSLPVYTRQNPEPIVSSSNDEVAQGVAKKLERRLIDIADDLRLKLKIKKATRYWALYYVGCIKIGWSMERNEIALRVIRPQKLIFDPDAITDECEYEGEYLGEYRTDIASDLVKRFPKKKDFIEKKVNKAMGTRLTYIEWWTNDYLFWEIEGEVLDKAKNPNWNYDVTNKFIAVDENGNEVETEELVKGKNHFSSPKIPYAFLSVFNLGKGPVDDTNLIEQVIPVQDVINKRVKQIDRNADQMNAGAVVSGDAFDKEQARQVADALRKGKTVWVPRGNVNSVYKRDAGTPLPTFVYESLVDARNELRNVFGVTGLTSSGIKSEQTVRGKILIRGTDTDRASLIVDHLEQFADYLFNWIVQMMYVHYDAPHSISRSEGHETIVNTELFPHIFTISVKPGSMIPKDRLTIRNEAIDLWSAGALDPITLFERLDDPNPYESARRLVMWKTNPLSLFPDLRVTPSAPQEPIQQTTPQGTSQENTQQPQNILSAVPIPPS